MEPMPWSPWVCARLAPLPEGRQEGPRALGDELPEPSPTPPAIHLHPAAEYDNVSIFHFPDVTINKAMIQKGLC